MSTLKNLKELIFNRGGIGKSLSREETIQRLNPIVRQHMELNYTYDAALRELSDDALSQELQRFQKIARTDVAKLRETILSAGGVADNGVDLSPDDFDLGEDEDAMLFVLQDRERELRDTVQGELDLDLPEHQIRTKAILMNVRDHSEERLNFLKEQTKARRPQEEQET